MALSEKAFWLWLQRGLGIGSHKLLPLLKEFGSPRLCFEAGEEAWRQWGKLSPKELERFSFYTPLYGEALSRYAETLGQSVLTPCLLYTSFLRGRGGMRPGPGGSCPFGGKAL